MPVESLLKGLVVLVVDDNDDSRDILRILLEACGATVFCAASGADALKIVAQRALHVLLSDIAMAKMDGLALMRNIRKRENVKRAEEGIVRYLPAAAVTAFTQPEDRTSCFAAGFSHHISKPFNLPEIIQTVQMLAKEAKFGT